jgi:anti-anti-sigma regulatory factor
MLNERPKPPRLIVLFMGNVPYADLAGAELLLDLESMFRRQGIGFRLAEVHGEVREALGRLGSTQSTGLMEAHQTVDDVVRKWQGTMPMPRTT